MSEFEPAPAPPAPTPVNLQELQLQHPEMAMALQSIVTKAVSSTEHHLADLPGEKKAELAKQKAIDLLDKVYDGADMIFGFPGPVDFLSKEVLIPLIPDLVDSVVSLFNHTGVFQSGGQGVQ